MTVLWVPSAARRMIRARVTSGCGSERDRVYATSCSRSAGESVSGCSGRPVRMGSPGWRCTNLCVVAQLIKLFMGHNTSSSDRDSTVSLTDFGIVARGEYGGWVTHRTKVDNSVLLSTSWIVPGRKPAGDSIL